MLKADAGHLSRSGSIDAHAACEAGDGRDSTSSSWWEGLHLMSYQELERLLQYIKSQACR